MIIYKHTCKINGKVYIGLTVKTMEARWSEHCADAKYHPKRKFFAAINKHGKDNWDHEILFESNDPQIIVDKEVELIKQYDSVANGYNTSHDRFRTNINHTPESIEKMRQAQRDVHAQRREENRDKHRPHKKHIWGVDHPRKGQPNPNCGPEIGKMGWKKINGIRTWFLKQEATV